MQHNVPSNPYDQPGGLGGYTATELDGEGSVGLGVLIGAVFGFWGLVGAHVFAKRLTKQGAGYGFFGQLAVGVLAICLGVVFQD
jgi:hypothetical protein